MNTAWNYIFFYSGIVFINYLVCLDLPHKIPVFTGECGHLRGQTWGCTNSVCSTLQHTFKNIYCPSNVVCTIYGNTNNSRLCLEQWQQGALKEFGDCNMQRWNIQNRDICYWGKGSLLTQIAENGRDNVRVGPDIPWNWHWTASCAKRKVTGTTKWAKTSIDRCRRCWWVMRRSVLGAE